MCSSSPPPPAPPPPPPPPPPPVLEQVAPETQSPTQGQVQQDVALGITKYKSQAATNANGGGTNTGLGISV